MDHHRWYVLLFSVLSLSNPSKKNHRAAAIVNPILQLKKKKFRKVKKVSQCHVGYKWQCRI